jgi:2-dehydro-3-deoxyphosphooctonate aldolase (KDO 8-P synthase)
MKSIELKNIKIGKSKPFVLIAGPCVVESKEVTFKVAETVKEICEKLKIPFIFKASYKKANRTSIDSFVTLGIDESLKILSDIKNDFNLNILTDVHTVEECKVASEVSDVLQIPAFLCRQTDLLVAAANTGKIVNIKKGQFLAPEDMRHAIGKVESTGNNKILLTERGTTFGYHNLVVDMRSLVIMKNLKYPVVMDATHAVQMPSNTSTSGGNPEFIAPLAKAAVAVGIDALFLEVHPDPPNAKSDSGSQLKLNELEKLLIEVKQIDDIVKSFN